jgi:eukaryotic-like serine/threonine-protein kinase
MLPVQDDVKSIFGRALEIESAAQRAAYLDEACRHEADLRAEVEALLDKLQEAGQFMAEPAAAALSDLTGAYESPVEEGGFGVVYVAEQETPVRRKVALKIIKPGMDSAQVIARFEAERQALAIMDHPNIAKVLDGGTIPFSIGDCRISIEKQSADEQSTVENQKSKIKNLGRPYFVMELFRGAPITEYCDVNKLAPRQRLELFVSVCHAIQHAHQKGIIHRDIKPSNVLVAVCDDKPVVKVIDFGVAKAIGQQLTEATLHTSLGAVVGTLQYMSPEQAGFNHQDIDTRSDIYGLGVVLYELLTGTTPLEQKRVKEKGVLEALRIIREEETPCPSARLSTVEQLPSISAQRQTEPGKLRKLVRGELDWIVMKALEKDRDRRYETASGLAMDLQRYLADEPVQACPPSLGYRLRKFARRNKRGLVTAALLGVMLLISVGVVAGSLAWVARDRTAQQAEMEREIDGLLGQVTLLREHGNWSEARAVLERADRLATQASSASQRQRVRRFSTDLDMAARLEEIGLWPVTGTPGNQPMPWDKARLAYAAAFRDYGIDIADLEPATAAERIRDSAISEHLLAGLDEWTWNHSFARLGPAAAWTVFSMVPRGKASQRTQELETTQKEVADVPSERLRAVANLADRDAWRCRIRLLPRGKGGRHAVEDLAGNAAAAALAPATALLLARALYDVGARDKALEIVTLAHQREPTDLRLLYELACITQWRANRDPAQLEKSAGFIRAGLALRPQSPSLHFLLGDHLKTAGHLDQAIAEFRKAMELAPNNNRPCFELGLAFAKKGARMDAISAFTRAIELNPEWHEPHGERGRLCAELGRWDQAAADYERVAALRPWHPELWCEHGSLLILTGKRQSYCQLSRRVVDSVRRGNLAMVAAGKSKNARTAYLAARTAVLAPNDLDDATRIVKLAEQPVAAYPKAAHYLHTLGMAHLRAGEFDTAIRRLRESGEIKPDWAANVVNWLGLAMAHHKTGQTAEARQLWQKATVWIDQAVAISPEPSLASIPGLHPHDWLACHVLRREAESLLSVEKKQNGR